MIVLRWLRYLPLAVVLTLTACGGHTSTSGVPYKTLPRPSIPTTETAPSCGDSTNHSLGQCLPKPKQTTGATLSPSQSLLGCDLSNNDPVFGVTDWKQIASKVSWCYLKVNESTGFVDSTAGPMARAAKAAGVLVGGYDFQHVCQGSAAAEADTFVRAGRADGLLGNGTLKPMADMEYPSVTSCNVRTWEGEWRAEVIRQTGENPGVYTGAWWWNPHVGCWWPAPYKGSDVSSWISGYVASLAQVPRPCGRSVITVWQSSDHGFNGHGTSDTSSWVAGMASLQAAVVGPPKPPPPTRTHCYGKHRQRSHGCAGLRKKVARWTRARNASERALVRVQCAKALPRNGKYKTFVRWVRPVRHRKPCKALRQRAVYFERHVHANLY